MKINGLVPLLQVFDMASSLHFYRDLLGFEVVTSSPAYNAEGDFHWALLRLEGVELMLNTAYDEGERPPAPDEARLASHGDVGLYFGCHDVNAAYEELERKGLNIGPPLDQRYGMRQLTLKDPDGYLLIFQRPV
ncbi:MAG TPA: VOC family protein [Acidisarcina sp.]